jgi:hypothetical protein
MIHYSDVRMPVIGHHDRFHLSGPMKKVNLSLSPQEISPTSLSMSLEHEWTGVMQSKRIFLRGKNRVFEIVNLGVS